MSEKRKTDPAPRPSVTRREVVRTAGALGVAASVGPFFHVRPARAAKTLKILQWNHFVPPYDEWFNNVYTKKWGEENDTEVIVDNVGIPSLNPRAASEVSARSGHDLFLFLWPPPVYEDEVIDHAEIYEECERKFGKAIDLAVRSTYNPKTKKYFGFSDSYVPDPFNYRKDLWDDVGVSPDTWDDVREGARKIKQKHGNPLGIGLSAEIDTGMAMRAIMYAHGSSIQDADGNLVLRSKETLDAIKFVKALYQESMTPEVLSWDASSNNRFMISGKGSAALNAISITRTAERQCAKAEAGSDICNISKNIMLADAPRGPVRRIGLEHVMNVYVIWKFAQNIEGAKKFLVDYVGNFQQGFAESAYYNFPCFPKTVPDLQERIAHDERANPPDKYKVLSDVREWATNVGYPGYANAAIDEIFSTWVVNTMFAKAATGNASPEEALAEAQESCERVWSKWREKGKL